MSQFFEIVSPALLTYFQHSFHKSKQLILLKIYDSELNLIIYLWNKILNHFSLLNYNFFSVYTHEWKGKLCIEAKEICLWSNLPLFKHLKSLLKERHWQTEKVGMWWIYLHSSQMLACWILIFFFASLLFYKTEYLIVTKSLQCAEYEFYFCKIYYEKEWFFYY